MSKQKVVSHSTNSAWECLTSGNEWQRSFSMWCLWQNLYWDCDLLESGLAFASLASSSFLFVSSNICRTDPRNHLMIIQPNNIYVHSLIHSQGISTHLNPLSLDAYIALLSQWLHFDFFPCARLWIPQNKLSNRRPRGPNGHSLTFFGREIHSVSRCFLSS